MRVAEVVEVKVVRGSVREMMATHRVPSGAVVLLRLLSGDAIPVTLATIGGRPERLAWLLGVPLVTESLVMANR